MVSTKLDFDATFYYSSNETVTVKLGYNNCYEQIKFVRFTRVLY